VPTGDIPDVHGNFNFLVEIDGIARASFQECTGLDATVDVIEYREGGMQPGLHKRPGLTKYSNIVLKRGITTDTQLSDWHAQIVRGQIERKTGSIVLLDQRGEEVARWNFVRAWPTKYDPGDLMATANDVAVETLEIVHEGMERVGVG
jgi:phage tail-like protein